MNSVIVVADDLIWMSRLAAAVERAGGSVVRVSSEAHLDAALGAPLSAVVIDLNGRAYDGVALVTRAAAGTAAAVVAVGQHEDVDLRRRALDAGAQRVYSYNRFFREGPALIEKLLVSHAGARR